MATAPVTQAQPGNPGGPGASNVGPTQPGQNTGDVTLQQVMQQFRPLAETIKQLGQQYPEGQEEAVQIMKSLQSWMAKVAGNSQRVAEPQGAPNP